MVPSQCEVLQCAVASRAFRGVSAEDVVDFARRSGLAGVEWSEDHLPAGEARRALAIRERTLDVGLAASGYASSWHVGRGSFRPVVDTALALGASTIRLRATGLASGNEKSVALTAIREALDVSLAAGLRVSLSYLPAAFDATVRFVREAAHPGLRLYWRAPSMLGEDRRPVALQKLRFCLPDVRVGEVTANRRRALDEAAGAQILDQACREGRHAVFDFAPPGLRREPPIRRDARRRADRVVISSPPSNPPLTP